METTTTPLTLCDRAAWRLLDLAAGALRFKPLRLVAARVRTEWVDDALGHELERYAGRISSSAGWTRCADVRGAQLDRWTLCR